MRFFIIPTAISAIAISLVSAAPAADLQARQVYTGDGTYYAVGLGACGVQNTGADYVAAVSYLLFDSYPGATSNPNLNPICGRRLQANYGGRSVQVAVEDRCEGCGMYDLDFSIAAFEQLADLSVGRLVDMTWSWI